MMSIIDYVGGVHDRNNSHLHPLFLQVQSKVPGLWDTCSYYLGIIWDFIVHYSLLVWKFTVYYAQIVQDWLLKNLLT